MSKKLVALIVSECLVVGGSLALAVWAIAATNVGLRANVSVTYNASPNVVCDVTATYQKKTDAAATPFESGGVSLAYSSAGGTRNMIASSQAISLSDTDTYVVFEYKFTNNNLMNTMGITIQPVDNGSVTGGITRKYYFGNLTSKSISDKQKTVLSNGIENSALSTSSYTLAQNETICFYMLIEITPGIRGEYLADDSKIFTFTLSAVEVEPSKVISYLSSDWATRLFSTSTEAKAVKSIIFTKDASKISGLSNSISLGTNSPTSTAAYKQAEGTEDVKAYYNDKTSIVIYSSGKIYAPQNSSYLFNQGTGSWSALKALAILDLSNFDTSNVSSMSNMFYYCIALTSLDFSNFDTSNVTDMSNMFKDCSALTSLDVSNFDTSNVIHMDYMFGGCSNLSDLNISNFNTSNATSMSKMFSFSSVLTSLDLSRFDTSKVADMSQMFYGCSSLTSLDVSNFDTSNVTNMSWMFTSCSALISLDVGSFNTSNVTDMSNMFEDCTALTSLNLGNFNLQSCRSFDNMLNGCSALTEIILPYNLQSDYTIDLPSVSGDYTWGEDISPGNVYAYTKIGTSTDTSSGVIACSTASNKVTLYKAERGGIPDIA